MQLHWLRSFVAVAETRSISRAAEALNFSQSTLSHHLHQLEVELCVSLLRRTPLPVSLTDAGRALMPYARMLVLLCDEATTQVRSGGPERIMPLDARVHRTAGVLPGQLRPPSSPTTHSRTRPDQDRGLR